MKRPRPHVPGMTNSAVADEEAPSKIDDTAQPAVPKSLRIRRNLVKAREKAAKLDELAYRRTDSEGGR